MYVVVSISNSTVHVWSPRQDRRGSLGARYEDRVNKSLTGFVHTSRPAQADGRAWRSVGQLARSSPLAKINELLWISSVMTRPHCGCFVKPQMAWTGRRDMFYLSLFWSRCALLQVLMTTVTARMTPAQTLYTDWTVATRRPLIWV